MLFCGSELQSVALLCDLSTVSSTSCHWKFSFSDLNRSNCSLWTDLQAQMYINVRRTGSVPRHFVLHRAIEIVRPRFLQGQRGCCPFPLHPKSPPQRLLRFALDNPAADNLDDTEHFLHNHYASVASLRLLFIFIPECRSASLRNRRSPSPEYPLGTGRFAALM